VADGLLRLAQPRLIVVADALYPAEQRAPTKLQRRLARHRTRVLYTRLCGAVTIEFKGSGWQARTMEGEVIDGRELPPYAAPMATPELEER
jgi:beta-lactamase superfamily II metal-dependent hydrolase